MSYASAAIVIPMAAVSFVLLLGLANMLRGGSPSFSQTLMRWRVGLQLIAVIVMMLVLWLKTG